MEGKPKHRPLPDYIEKVQSDLTPHMRQRTIGEEEEDQCRAIGKFI
jgi:hypothetical protein